MHQNNILSSFKKYKEIYHIKPGKSSMHGIFIYSAHYSTGSAGSAHRKSTIKTSESHMYVNVSQMQ